MVHFLYVTERYLSIVYHLFPLEL